MTFGFWRDAVRGSTTGEQGVDELEEMAYLFRASDYGPGRIHV